MAARNSLIVRSTVQAVILSAISNTLAQLIACHQANRPYTIDPTQLSRFLLFSIISCPPNVIWQTWLEQNFPAYPASKPHKHSGVSSNNNEKPSTTATGQSISLTNTIIKFILDQTLGALFNTVLFIAGMDILRGQADQRVIARHLREQSWPLMRAGQKVWPLVSLLSFTLVPLEWRTAFGGVVGIGWGVYLSLVEGKRKL